MSLPGPTSPSVVLTSAVLRRLSRLLSEFRCLRGNKSHHLCLCWRPVLLRRYVTSLTPATNLTNNFRALLVSPLTTLSIRRFGTKPTLGAGVIIQAAALIAASFSTEVWHLLLTQGIAFGIGMGLAFNATVGVVPQWFRRRRSFAAALSTGGSGFGGLIYSLATNAMIDNIGLAWAFRVLALLSLVVNGGCCLLVKDRNKAIGTVLTAFNWRLLRKVEFWLFVSWGFFSLFGYVIVIFSLPDYGQSVGFSASQGSLAAAILNCKSCVPRLYASVQQKLNPSQWRKVLAAH